LILIVSSSKLTTYVVLCNFYYIYYQLINNILQSPKLEMIIVREIFQQRLE
jgi:hypothetical protein